MLRFSSTAVVTSLTIILVALSHVQQLKADSSGLSGAVSPEVCSTMTPQYNVSAQTSQAPYTINVTSTSGLNCYTPGQSVTVVLFATRTTFSEFLMEARVQNDSSLGWFDSAGSADVATVNCFGQTSNAISHSHSLNKTQAIYQWTPPSNLTGSIRLTATVVENPSVFWVQGVTLSLADCDLTAGSTGPPGSTIATITTATVQNTATSTATTTTATVQNTATSTATTTTTSVQNAATSTATTTTTTVQSAATSTTDFTRSTGPSGSTSTTTPTIIELNAISNIVGPKFGPLAGGTRLTLVGEMLSLALLRRKRFVKRSSTSGQTLNVKDVNIGNYPTTIDKNNSVNGSIVLETTAANESGNLSVILVLSNGSLVNTGRAFEYRNNTIIDDIQPRRHIIQGGTLVNVNGSNMDSVDNPIISLTVVVTQRTTDGGGVDNVTTNYQSCKVINGFQMTCPVPVLALPWDLENATYTNSTPGIGAYTRLNGSERADIYLGFVLDGYAEYRNISKSRPDIKIEFYQKPTLSCPESNTFNPDKDEQLAIQGSDLTRGSRLVDFSVTLGDGVCEVVSVTDNQLTCTPPSEKPNKGNSSLCSDEKLAVEVSIGFAKYSCSCLEYTSTNNKPTRDRIIAGLVIGLLLPFIVGIVAAICFHVYYDKSRQPDQLAFTKASSDGPYSVKLPADDSEEESETAVDSYNYSKDNSGDENANTFREVVDVHNDSADDQRFSHQQLPGFENPNYSTT